MSAHPEALPHRRPFEMPGWGVTLVALLVLAAAVVGGVAIGRATTDETASVARTAPAVEGLADAGSVALIGNMLAAWSSGDGQEAAGYFTSDAIVVNDIGGYSVEGTGAIAKTASTEGRNGVLVVPEGPMIETSGGFVAQSFTWAAGAGITVYEIRYDGLISKMWVHGF